MVLPALLVLLAVACQDRQSVRHDSASIGPADVPANSVHPTAAVTPTSPTTKPFAAISDQQRLHNGYVVTEKVISGAQPEGDASFDLLKELGVKTIISVDGAKPDVERAKRYGMRYVHLPIGYDGVDAAEGKAIAKAISELPGPVYVHCHHGRHRSAAAVAVACVYNGMLKPEQAEDVLKTFGTGANYTGLWKSAREAKPIDAEELRQLKVDYVETAKIADTAAAMVEVDQRWEHLKQIQNNKWQPPKDHPDLDPAHEALQLQELLHEMRRADSAHAKVPDYQKLLTQGENGAQALREALSAKPLNTDGAEAAFKTVATSCTACHKGYRD